MKYTFCPILLEKLEYPRTNGQSKAGVSNLEIPAHYYNTYAREDYLLSDRLNLFLIFVLLALISYLTALRRAVNAF